MATRAQVTAAYNAALAAGVRLTLETAERIADAILAVTSAGLSRSDALQVAVSTVDSLSVAPMKANGHPVDGYRAPSLSERVDAIATLVRVLLGEEN